MRISESVPIVAKAELARNVAFDSFGRFVFGARHVAAFAMSHAEARSNANALQEVLDTPGAIDTENTQQKFFLKRKDELYREKSEAIMTSTIEHRLGSPQFLNELLTRLDD